MKRALFIFRRDLRLQDNIALDEALGNADEIVPAFIFDPRQVGKNPYKSRNAVQFMVESLKELDSGLRKKGSRLYLFYGKAEEITKNLIGGREVDSVFLNLDYTPFSRKRDSAIERVCSKEGAEFYGLHDCLLHKPGSVLKDDGEPYVVYSAFRKKAKKNRIRKPRGNRKSSYFRGKMRGEMGNAIYKKVLGEENEDIFAQGGRKNALRILRNLEKYKNYPKERDYPAKEATTGLSPHNKFGTVSIREVYWAIAGKLGKRHGLIGELYWREFFTHIGWFFPKVFRGPFREQYSKIRWENGKKKFGAWCEGKTGYPLVDAGMRQLNKTGYMHNRVRMVAASFLVKDLHIDWRWGEKYFAQKLVDYDRAVNNGNWQWIASTGCDAQPYFRIFNPESQRKKYDSGDRYVEKWADAYREGKYPAKIVEHKKEAEKAKKEYKKMKK